MSKSDCPQQRRCRTQPSTLLACVGLVVSQRQVQCAAIEPMDPLADLDKKRARNARSLIFGKSELGGRCSRLFGGRYKGTLLGATIIFLAKWPLGCSVLPKLA